MARLSVPASQPTRVGGRDLVPQRGLPPVLPGGTRDGEQLRPRDGSAPMTVEQLRPAGRASHRLDPQPGEVIDRGRTLGFTWNGRPATAHHGDSIASALAAAGERVLSRSFKYHRPRGILTASYHDPGCILQVGDEPNVRAAHRLVAEHVAVAAVRRQVREPAGGPLPRTRVLLQDVHEAGAVVAHVREGAGALR